MTKAYKLVKVQLTNVKKTIEELGEKVAKNRSSNKQLRGNIEQLKSTNKELTNKLEKSKAGDEELKKQLEVCG
jgi:septal ring factor EnvC (AmiA/AmiB activator)